MKIGMTAVEIIALLQLEPHPAEGGFFRETYRSHESIAAAYLPCRYGDSRAFSTAIYYLLTPETCSRLHCLQSDEVFHFYLGGAVEMLQLFPDGQGKITILGHDIAAGMNLQHMVPANSWQGARLCVAEGWALLGTTVAPGFDFADYERGQREELQSRYPAFADRIARLT